MKKKWGENIESINFLHKFKMEKLNLKEFNIKELDPFEMIETNGGFPWGPLVLFIAGAIAGGVLYDATKEAAFGITDNLCERASKDNYVIYADIGHR